jgi:hypothetical protein
MDPWHNKSAFHELNNTNLVWIGTKWHNPGNLIFFVIIII